MKNVLMELLMGTDIKYLLDPLKLTRMTTSIGHSACKIGRVIFYVIRENIQAMEDAP